MYTNLRIDANDNGYISVDELKNYIISKVKEHLQGALRENIFLFTAVDINPRDGRASWVEYQTWFFKKNGINSTDLDNKDGKLSRSIQGIFYKASQKHVN